MDCLRFLDRWDCKVGEIAFANSFKDYDFRNGDYFVICNIDDKNNYAPYGSSYKTLRTQYEPHKVRQGMVYYFKNGDWLLGEFIYD